MNIVRTLWFVLILLTVGANVSLAASTVDTLASIDKNESYDIYYGGTMDGSSFIARRVKIVRIEQINGMDFLVFINDAGFNAKAREGYVLFSAVKAIIPESTFTIINNRAGER